MTNEHESTLTRVFTEVLEQLAFMFVEQPDSDAPPATGGLAVASMSFHGPISGSLYLAVPQAMAPVLAANVLGIDVEEAEAAPTNYDALKELLNITCGNVLTAIAGDEPVFDLTVPEIEERPETAWPELYEQAGTIYCLADDFPVLLRIEIQP